MSVDEVKHRGNGAGFAFAGRTADENQSGWLRNNLAHAFGKTEFIEFEEFFVDKAYCQCELALVEKNRETQATNGRHFFGIGDLTLFAENFTGFRRAGFENYLLDLIFTQLN